MECSRGRCETWVVLVEGGDKVGSCVGVVRSVPTVRRWRRRLMVDSGMMRWAQLRAHVRAEMWRIVWRCAGKSEE